LFNPSTIVFALHDGLEITDEAGDTTFLVGELEGVVGDATVAIVELEGAGNEPEGPLDELAGTTVAAAAGAGTTGDPEGAVFVLQL